MRSVFIYRHRHCDVDRRSYLMLCCVVESDEVGEADWYAMNLHEGDIISISTDMATRELPELIPSYTIYWRYFGPRK